MLNKDETEFHKNIENFNIREAVDEILVIQNDKVKMKDIQVSTQYLGFDQFKIKTDQKRFQQVFLNIYANAIKFTDRGGKIFIRIEHKIVNDNDQNLLISIIDQGVGIKKKDQI